MRRLTGSASTTHATTTMNHDDAVLQELVSCQSQGKGSAMIRDSYETRLRTFSSSLRYFAKPACLSPLVCARLGFCNVATNMLQCTACQAALEIDIPSSLSATARHSLTCKLEEQLEVVHQTGCRFRHDAACYFRPKEGKDYNDEDDTSLVPMILAQAFRAGTMELLDPPKPQTVIRQRCQILADYLRKSLNDDDHHNTTYGLHMMQIPKQLLEYREEGQDSEQCMFCRASDMLFESGGNNESFPDKEVFSKALALVVLGWSPVTSDSRSSQYQLECPICWSCCSPVAVSSSSPPPNKRVRTSQLDAWQAHRHYCPFVCGFPRASESNSKATTPLWQSLLRRLLLPMNNATRSTDASSTPSRVEIFQMLQSGVSHKKRLGVSSKIGDLS